MPSLIDTTSVPIDWSISSHEGKTPEPTIDTSSNKGAQLLRKMGWKEGEGLGTSNTGIKEPIRVEKEPRDEVLDIHMNEYLVYQVRNALITTTKKTCCIPHR